jgi:hypothetical protein
VHVVVAQLDRAVLGGLPGSAAQRPPATAIGDTTELLDVHVHQLAGPGPLVARGGLLRRPDDRTGHRVQGAQRGLSTAGQDPGHRPGRHPQLGAEPIRTATLTGSQLDDAVLGLDRGAPRADVRAAGPILQPGLTLGGVAGDPGPHALARDPHRRGDVRLLPAGSMPLDDQLAAVDGESGITVGHENLRADVGLRQATPHSEVLLRSTRPAVTNVLAGYT